MLDQQAHRCFICGEPMHADRYVKHHNPRGWNIDHLTPRARGGPDRLDNYVLTHVKCNSRRGDAMPTKAEFRKFRMTFGRPAFGSPEWHHAQRGKRARKKRKARQRDNVAKRPRGGTRDTGRTDISRENGEPDS